MRRWHEALRLTAVLLAVAVSGNTATVRAQVRPVRDPVAAVADVEQILRDGVQLEQQRRWGEALSHYEDALRKHPGRREFVDRLSTARVHYEVGRRYTDQTFLASVRDINEREALDLYGDVLLKIHAHYVERPDWSALLRRGGLAMEIALAETAFQHQHKVHLSDAMIQNHLSELNHALASRPVRTRQESRDTVTFVAHSTADRLGIPAQAVVLEYACAAGASLDDYSSFLTGSQLDEIMSQIEGNFVGLGIELKAELESLLIVNVIPGGPAERGGLKAGDRIVEVNGQTMRDVSTDTAADMLKGEEGTNVDLVVLDAAGAKRRLRVPRQVVEVPSVERTSIVDSHYGIGYLKLGSFQKNTSRDVEAALWQLHREGMRSLIVDVRGNPGGLLTASVEVADKFITEGTIVSTRGRGTGEDFDYKAHLVGTWRVPLTVLIDGDSASASEIFAAAIRDSQRGTIVGQRSFGKGSVQGIFPLSVGHAGLRLTTAKFFSPNGTGISGQGVQPHVSVSAAQQTVAKPVIEGGQANLPADADPALAAALQVARQQVAKR
jgi:carboxyl-terminal processing protease